MAPGPGAAEDTFPVEDDDVSELDEFDIAGPGLLEHVSNYNSFANERCVNRIMMTVFSHF